MKEFVHQTTPVSLAVLLVWAVVFTAQIEAAATADVPSSSTGSIACDPGWTFHLHHCYRKFDEPESFSDADSTCRLFGGKLAYARHQKDFEIIESLISTSTDFGFWYGAEIYPSYGTKGRYDVFLKSEIDSSYDTLSRDLYGKTVPLPPIPELKKPMNSPCVSLAFNIDESNPYMLSMACNTTLPYACRGGMDTAPRKNDTNYLVLKDDVFWLSSAEDRKNFDDASKACLAKAMTLASFRDNFQMGLVQDKMKNRDLQNANPWWIGLQMMNGVGSWTSGIPFDSGVAEWTHQQTSLDYVLRPDMTLLMTDAYFRAPFICYKKTRQTGKYGCPHTWSRAGQSCYRKATGSSFVTREKAVSLCKKMDSHLISLDTDLEKAWFMESMAERYETFWTSLNDKQTKGTYLWDNGAKPKPAVVTWSASLSGYGECYALSIYNGLVHKTYCADENLPGCQYKSKTGNCVSKNWSYLNGNCYFIPHNENQDYYERYTNERETLFKCYNDTVQYDSTIKLQRLKLDSKDIIKLYQKAYSYDTIWTGLQRVQGTLLWSDNTKVDMSFLTAAKQPDPGTKDAPKSCATMDGQGLFTTENCNDCVCGIAFCEKEIAYHPAGVNGASTICQSGFGAKLLFLLVSAFFLTGFLA